MQAVTAHKKEMHSFLITILITIFVFLTNFSFSPPFCRFAEKQLKYKNLKSVHRTQQQTCTQLLHKRKLAEDLQFAIKQKRENIHLLRKLIDERKTNLKLLSEKNLRLIGINRSSQKQGPTYSANCQHFAGYIEKTSERNEKLNDERLKLFEQLKQCRILNIQKLLRFIFPISQRISKGESSTIDFSVACGGGGNAGDLGSGTNTVNELAEATRTAYVRGRWVLQDSHGELQHVIVAPALPGECFFYARITDRFPMLLVVKVCQLFLIAVHLFYTYVIPRS